MLDHIKRDYDGLEKARPYHYVKMEVESYDPANIYFNYKTGYTGSNILQKRNDDWYYYTGSNQGQAFTLNTTHNIRVPGDYRVEVFCLTTTYSEKVKLSIGGRQIGAPVSVKARDTFMRRLDFGIQNLPSGKVNFSLNCGGHVGIISVYLRKVRITSGDTENNGLLVIKDAKGVVGNSKQADTLDVNVQNIDRAWADDGFKEPGNKTGLIFEYRDPVNFYAINTDGKLQRVFGGYMSTPLVSDDKTKIKFSCAGRLKDAELRSIVKQITVGGAISEVTTLTYTARDLYDALSYLCESVETPINLGNIDKIASSIPNKTGHNSNYASKTAQNKLSVQNLSKSSGKNYVVLRNGAKKGSTQYSVLWESSWNKKSEATGFKITDTPVFYLKYGLGQATTTVKKKKVYGYDQSKPFLAWIEIQYSTTPTGTRKTVNIEFSANTATNRIGKITPIWKNGVTRQGELDVLEILEVTDPSANYYLRRIALKYVVPSGNDLYDSKTEHDSYKMALFGAGFKAGDPLTVEVLQTSGQKVADYMDTLQTRLGFDMYMIYGQNRSQDKLMLVKEESQVTLIEFKEGIGGNVLGVANINYTPITSLKNSIIKIFKTGSNTNSYVAKKDVASIFRFGEHQDLEVLNDDVGAYYAGYLARTDVDEKTDVRPTYTLNIEGFPDVHEGQLVISTLENQILNDMQPILSIEYEYDTDKRPSLETTVGLGEMNPDLRADLNMVALRKTIENKRTAFSGGATEEEHVDLY